MTSAAPRAPSRPGRFRRLLLLPRSMRSKLLIIVLVALLPLFIFSIATGLERQRVDGDNLLLAQNLAVLSMAGLLGLIAAWRGGDILIRQQIVNLSKTAQLLTSGDFTARATVTKRGGELDDLALSFNLMAEALQLEERIAVEMAEMNKALELAETIQTLLLPQREIKIEGLDIAAVYRPCRQLGGDAYDIVGLAADMVGFVMADISGHSVSSSLLMTAAHSVTRLLLSEAGSAPAAIITRLNDFFQEDLDRAGAFFSIFIGFSWVLGVASMDVPLPTPTP